MKYDGDGTTLLYISTNGRFFYKTYSETFVGAYLQGRSEKVQPLLI